MPAAENIGSAPIGVTHPSGINTQSGRTSSRMTETAGDRAQVDSSREELRRRVVPERVKVAIDPERGAHVGVPVRHSTRVVGAIKFWPMGEQESVLAQLKA